MAINYIMATADRERLHNLRLYDYVLIDIDGYSNAASSGGLDVYNLLRYIGKASMIKPYNDDGKPVFLSAQLYDDEACNTSPIVQLDTSTDVGRHCTFAFLGSTIDNADVNSSWIPLTQERFDEGLGPEFNNFPIVVDFTKNDDMLRAIANKLIVKNRLYLRYSWYWTNGFEKHQSDYFSMAFPSIAEVGPASKHNPEEQNDAGKRINVVNEIDDDDNYVICPNIPNIISPALVEYAAFLFDSYSAENLYKVKFTIGDEQVDSIDINVRDASGAFVKSDEMTCSLEEALKKYNAEEDTAFKPNKNYFITFQLGMVTQFSASDVVQS